MRAWIVASALLVSSVAPVGAQQPNTARDTSDVYRLPGLEARVTRGLQPLETYPAAVTVLDASAVQGAYQSISPDEILNLVPGVVAANRNTYALDSRISIRGFGTRAFFGVRGVRIMVDGIPLTMADGQATLNNLDMGSAGRIEVIRGPASALYGNGAGGVISIESEAPAAGPFSLEVNSLFGDYGRDSFHLRPGEQPGTRRLTAKASGQTDNIGYFTSVSRLDTHGFRDNSRIQHTLLNSRARVQLDDRSYFSVVLNAVDMPIAANPGALTRAEFDSAQDNSLSKEVREAILRKAAPDNIARAAGKSAQQIQSGVAYAHAFNSARLDVSLYGVYRDNQNPQTFTYFDLQRAAGGLRATLRTQEDIGGLPLSLVFGADLDRQRDKRLEFGFRQANPARDSLGGIVATDSSVLVNFATPTRNQREAVDAFGPFVQATLGVTSRLDLTAGFRFDRMRFEVTDRLGTRPGSGAQGTAPINNSGQRTMQDWSPMAGASFRALDNLTLFGNFATSFQTPTTTELLNVPPAPGETYTPGFNENLEAQRSRGLELGLKGRPLSSVQLDLAVYQSTIQGELVPYTTPLTGTRNYFRNAGESQHRGVEIGVGWRPVPEILISLASTFTDLQFKDYTVVTAAGRDTTSYAGNKIPGVAPRRLFLRTEAGRWGLNLGADIEHSARYPVNDANDEYNDAYTVANLRLTYRNQLLQRVGVEPFLGINNIFDKVYSSSVAVNVAAPAVAASWVGRQADVGTARPDLRRIFEPAPGRSIYFGINVPYTPIRR